MTCNVVTPGLFGSDLALGAHPCVEFDQDNPEDLNLEV